MKSVATWPHYPLTATRFTSADIAIYIGHQPQVGWRFVVKQEDYRQVGPIYATKDEILADLPRYAGTWANEWKEENSMTPSEQNRAARQEWLRKGGEDFAARCQHGSDAIGTDGTFISARLESAYLGSTGLKETVSRFTANASRQQFLDAAYPGAANGTTVEGALISAALEAEYQIWLAGQAGLAYVRNIEARQAYYDSLGHAIHRDVVGTMHVMFMTNTAGHFVTSTTEACFLKWQAQQNRDARQKYLAGLYDLADIRGIEELTTEAGVLKDPQAEAHFLAQQAEPDSEFTQAEQSALDALRSKGFALVIFTPSELENMDDHASIEDLEGRMISVGNEYIDDHEKE